MYHVIVPVDVDENRAARSARYVVNLVDDGPVEDPDRLTVTVFNVFKEFEAVDEGGKVDSAELFDEDDYPDAALEVKSTLEAAGLAVDLARRHGEPAEEIIAYAAEVDADEIVMAPRKRSTVGKAMFGSVGQEVIIDADRPVVVV